ncbi:MAG: hypothetical protein WBW48_13210 [Anaerolineae bacterium]
MDTPVKRYSSGMYVRLAFAVAAHRSAERSRRSLEPETCPEPAEGSAGGREPALSLALSEVEGEAKGAGGGESS